ncbi:MAG: hypothetical protein OXL97_09495 [Chloroflexota bacterium]|nr:hypothetical protein [Chloroflexota bacterium]MDE2885552.1 hypothetical protein [Chloroflexota bacterium]
MSTPGMTVEEMTRQMYADLYTNTPSIKSTLVKLEADVAWIKRLMVGLGVPLVISVVAATVKFIFFGA